MKHPDSQQSSFRLDAFVIIALWSIAVTQPLLNTLGDAATFFVAHDAKRFHILSFVILIALVGPAIVIGLEFILDKTNKRLRRVFHFIVMAILATGFFLILIKAIGQSGPFASVIAAIICGLLASFMLLNFATFRGITAIVSIGAIAFPILFLFFTPVASITMGKSTQEFTKVNFETSTPVVLIVFDEFSPLSLLDKDNKIDPVRFPNIAEFASAATWFPNATAAHNSSFKAVPAILTGQIPPKKNVLPTQANYENNVFTLLGEEYNFNAIDHLTALCPDVYCPSDKTSNKFKVKPFVSDIQVISKHVYYPVAWAEAYLPVLNTGWRDFAKQGKSGDNPEKQAAITREEANKLVTVKTDSLFHADDVAIFQKFVESIEPGTNTFDYMHLVFPHTPWLYLPDGRTYDGLPVKDVWQSDAEAEQSYHRYLMQVGVVDTMVGDLTNRLKSVGKYDDALIIIIADHGLNFKKGIAKRGLRNPAVLHVPFLVKLPNQSEGRINDRFVSTLDVVPTIAGVLGINLPWPVDGSSVFDNAVPERSTVTTFSLHNEKKTFERSEIIDFDAVPYRIEKFGERTPLESLSNAGTFGPLLGRKVGELDEVLTRLETAPSVYANIEKFQNIDIESNHLPVMLKGEITLTEQFYENFSVAIAVNGEISTIVLAEGFCEIREFNAILPPVKIKNGANYIQFYLVRKNDNGQVFLIDVDVKSKPFGSEPGENCAIEDETGQKFVLNSYGITGTYNTEIYEQKNMVVYYGWALDAVQKTPPLKILMFQDGKFVRSVKPDKPTPKLAKSYKAEEALAFSGFSFAVKSETMTNLENVQLIAVFPSGFASEIPFNRW